MTLSYGLITWLEAYALSVWYDFVVDSPLAIPKVVQLTLQYMTISYIQIFHQLFAHFVLIAKAASLY
jgi:hypothetical protein